MKSRLIFLSLPLLMACERNSATPTTEENRQLDEAERLLNEAPANLEAVDDFGLDEANNSEEAR
jgi:hypothetical protein